MSQIYVSQNSIPPIYATIIQPEKTTKIIAVEKNKWEKCFKLCLLLSIIFVFAIIIIAVISCSIIFGTPTSKLKKTVKLNA